jgi:hypothetical protein
MHDYFAACITGTTPLHERLAAALGHVGCTLEVAPQPGDAVNVQVVIKMEAKMEAETARLRKWLGIGAPQEINTALEKA